MTMTTTTTHHVFRRLHIRTLSSFVQPQPVKQPVNRFVNSTRPFQHQRRFESTATPSNAPAAEGLSTAGSIFFSSLCVITFGLGVWQTQRYFEKVELVSKRQDDLNLPPLTYEEWLAASNESKHDMKDAKSYRLVKLRGTFQNQNQILIGPRGPPPGALAESGPNSGRGGGGGMSSSMQGYWVVTPFLVGGSGTCEDANKDFTEESKSVDKRGWFGRLLGSKNKVETNTKELDPINTCPKEETIVWINRGWIPRHFVNTDSTIAQEWDEPKGSITVMAMESETETPGRFSPPSRLETRKKINDVDSKSSIQKLLWLDREAISEMTNCPNGHNPPLFVQIKDANASNAMFPARSSQEYVGEFKVTPAVHAGYAATWFGLSGAGVVMTRKLLSRGR